jgi:flavin reductase (DIM6/NTAB) family NADH-FMN oxidoreductase RutF
MDTFYAVSRQKFRQHFQPSRIALAVFQAPDGPPNVITLAFDMYCSYKPNMMAFAVHRKSYTHRIQELSKTCVLAIPGRSLAHFAMYCGTESGRDVNKVEQNGISLAVSKYVPTPGLDRAIANIELEIVHRLQTGDHTTIVGAVRSFNVNSELNESCLLSVGPKHEGYQVLVRRGIHRIAVVVPEREKVDVAK